MTTADRRPVVAVDLGGTKIIAALVSPEGRMLLEQRMPTDAYAGLDIVVQRLCSAIDLVISQSRLKSSELRGISIAAAGSMDLDRGIITLSPNLPGWRDVPLRDIVHKKCGIDTCLVNDASAGALGEHRFGAGRGTQD